MHDIALLQKLNAKQLEIVLRTNPEKHCFPIDCERSGGTRLIEAYERVGIPNDLIDHLLLSHALAYENGTEHQDIAANLYRHHDKRCGTHHARRHAIQSGMCSLIQAYAEEFPDAFHWLHLAQTGDVAYSNGDLSEAVLCYEQILTLLPESSELLPHRIRILRRIKKNRERIIHRILRHVRNECDLELLTVCLSKQERELSQKEQDDLKFSLKRTFIYGTEAMQSDQAHAFMRACCDKTEKKHYLNALASRGEKAKLEKYAQAFQLRVTVQHKELLYRHAYQCYTNATSQKVPHLKVCIEILRELVKTTPRHLRSLNRTLVLTRKYAILEQDIIFANVIGQEIGEPLTLAELEAFHDQEYTTWDKDEFVVFKMIELIGPKEETPL